MVVDKFVSPGSGPSSGSGGSYGGKVTTAPGGGEPREACDSRRAWGVGEISPIGPLRAAEFGTTSSAETHQAELE